MKELTISRQQARDLHNGICYLRDVINELEEVLNVEKLKKLKKGFSSVESVRSAVYEIIDAEENAMWENSKTFSSSQGITASLWSYYDIDDLMSEHSFPIGAALKSWETSTTHTVTSSTWGGLWKDIDNWIKSDPDEFGTHIFIEGFKYDRKENTLTVFFGS